MGLNSVGTIVCYVISSLKIVFTAQTSVVHDQDMLDVIKSDSFERGQPLPEDAINIADIGIKWSTLLLKSLYPGGDTVILDGGYVVGIAENAVAPLDYLVVVDSEGTVLSEPTVYEASCHSGGGVFTVQIKHGSGGGDSVGAAQTIQFEPRAGLFPMDKSSEVLNASGRADFTMGSASGFCGSFKVVISASGGDPRDTTLRLRYT